MDIINTSNLTLTELSAAVIVFNIILSFILSVIIAVIYQKTHHGLSYSKSFIESMVMMSVLAAIAMMILGNNLVRALGILGVFTLIRFRTIIKDPKDATYLFFSLAVGMAVGTSNYVIGIIGTIALIIIIFILYKYNFGSIVRDGFLLTLIVNKNFTEDFYRNLFEQHLSSYKLLQIKSRTEDEKEYYFAIRFKKNYGQEKLLETLNILNGVLAMDLINGKDAIEH